MKLFLDTSYLLSYFKIAIQGIPPDFLFQLMKKADLELLISPISYSELVAKCFKLSLSENQLTIEDILGGLDAVRKDSHFTIMSWFDNPHILESAYNLRKIHPDFFDCIIFASAIQEADAIGTFDDSVFQKIKKNAKIANIFLTINPDFEFWFYDFKKKPEKLKIGQE